ncbi:Uncharacterised protein [Candidatus Bartonella washoeensis]|nr:Uncharacterised protein [Bartonella washoeensis]
MNIRYEIISMFCMLIVFVPIFATTSKVFGVWSWKLSITTSLLSGILFFIVDYLCRYFGIP